MSWKGLLLTADITTNDASVKDWTVISQELCHHVKGQQHVVQSYLADVLKSVANVHLPRLRVPRCRPYPGQISLDPPLFSTSCCRC